MITLGLLAVIQFRRWEKVPSHHSACPACISAVAEAGPVTTLVAIDQAPESCTQAFKVPVASVPWERKTVWTPGSTASTLSTKIREFNSDPELHYRGESRMGAR